MQEELIGQALAAIVQTATYAWERLWSTLGGSSRGAGNSGPADGEPDAASDDNARMEG